MMRFRPLLKPLFLLAFLFCGTLLRAQDLYWEDPRFVVPEGALFSQSLSSDDSLIQSVPGADPVVVAAERDVSMLRLGFI